MMKLWVVFLLIFIGKILFSQSKDIEKAKNYYATFVKEGKVSDIEKSYDIIKNTLSDEKIKNSADAHFYYAVIVKQFIESTKPANKADLILQVTDALLQIQNLDSKFSKKEQMHRLMQIIGYDLYMEGITAFKADKHQKAYDIYRKLIAIQTILNDNKLDFTLKSSTGESSTLSSQDIMNNLAVFCINAGKKDEAKSIFESKIKSEPSALSYARLIQLCNQLDDKVSANRYIEEGINLYPNDPDLLVFAINKNLDEKNTSKALDLIDKALEVAPQSKLIMVKAQIYEGRSDFEKAIETYRQGLKRYPDDFDINYGMGYALFNASLTILNQQDEKTRPQAMKHINDAKKYFNKAKSIDPNKVDIDKVITQVNEIK